MNFLFLCESQNRPVGPGGEISLLGEAAPLSSRKTGYLLRVAQMIPIIFFRRNGSRRPTAGLHSLALLASLFCYTHGNNYIFLPSIKGVIKVNIVTSLCSVNERFIVFYFLYLCESQNWPVGPGGEISLLGVAAPLSSRKTGYL